MSEPHRIEPSSSKGHRTLVEISEHCQSIRDLRANLLGLAYPLLDDRKSRAVFVLVNSSISPARVQEEWSRARALFQPSVGDRITILQTRGSVEDGLLDDLERGVRDWLEPQLKQRVPQSKPQTKASYDYAVLRVLVHQYLLGLGPVTTSWLMDTLGCSYPTVAKALKAMKRIVHRQSDRRVELVAFPREEWAALVSVSDRVRSTIRFADTSGQPHSPESLLKRLRKLNRTDVAVGGVWGAKRYAPNLDILGNPRLDLSVLSSSGAPDLKFIETLDPALKRSELGDEACPLVIHLVHRRSPLFLKDTHQHLWADPVECLLDLHEMRFETQAEAFVATLKNARASK